MDDLHALTWLRQGSFFAFFSGSAQLADAHEYDRAENSPTEKLIVLNSASNMMRFF